MPWDIYVEKGFASGPEGKEKWSEFKKLDPEYMAYTVTGRSPDLRWLSRQESAGFTSHFRDTETPVDEEDVPFLEGPLAEQAMIEWVHKFYYVEYAGAMVDGRNRRSRVGTGRTISTAEPIIKHGIVLKKQGLSENVLQNTSCFKLQVVLHFAAASSHTYHAYKQWEQQSGTRFSIAQDLLFSLSYTIGGIFIPVRTLMIKEASPILMLITLRTHYQDMYPDEMTLNDVGHWMQASWVIWPIAVLVGTVPPVIVWSPSPSEATDCLLEACFLTWCFCAMFFGSAVADGVVFDACRKVSRGLTLDMKTLLENVDWAEISRSYQELDRTVTRLFSLQCMGALWCCRISMLAAISLLMMGASMSHPVFAVRFALRAGSLLFSSSCVALLYSLAQTTELMASTDPTKESIVAAALSHIGSEPEIMEDTQWRFFNNFLLHLQTRRIGVRILGVRITSELVGIASLRLCVYLPVLFGFIAQFLIDEDQEEMSPDGDNYTCACN